MQFIGQTLFKFLPLIFAFGFLVPVINQTLVTLGWQPPLGMSTLSFAFLVGAPWGLFASLKGRWV